MPPGPPIPAIPPAVRLQLDVEAALKHYIEKVIDLFGTGDLPSRRPVHAAHATETDELGTFLLIIAPDPPDWEDMIINAELPVRFEFVTGVKNPETRANAVLQHQQDVCKLIELLCDQKFSETRDGLNSVNPDFLGFTGWEATKPEPDGTTDTAIVSRLPYDFVVYLTS